ncbi:MAG: hypothetical protein ABII71_06270 [Candidatus Micrarchaeota archaeon]
MASESASALRLVDGMRNAPAKREREKAESDAKLAVFQEFREICRESEGTSDLAPLAAKVSGHGIENLDNITVSHVHSTFMKVLEGHRGQDKEIMQCFSELTRSHLVANRKQRNLTYLAALFGRLAKLGENDLADESRAIILEAIDACGKEGSLNPLMGIFRGRFPEDAEVLSRAEKALAEAAAVRLAKGDKKEIGHLMRHLDGLGLGREARKSVLRAAGRPGNRIAGDGILSRLAFWRPKELGRSEKPREKLSGK